jgi:hypothetical protein
MGNHYDSSLHLYRCLGHSRNFGEHLPMLAPTTLLAAYKYPWGMHKWTDSILYVNWRTLPHTRCRPSAPSCRCCLAIEIAHPTEGPDHCGLFYWRIVSIPDSILLLC